MNETTSLGAEAPATPGVRDRRSLYRAAGIGGIVAFGCWLLQPILVFLIVGDRAGAPSWQYFQDFPWNGVYEGLTFGGIGVGILVLVTATGILIDREGDATTGSRLLTWFGMLAGSMWLLTAGVTFVPFTSVGYFVRELIPETADQNAVFQALVMGITGLLISYALLSVGWLVLFGIVARRRGVIGRPLAVLAMIAAAVACAGFFTPFAPPWAAISPLLYLLILGVALLVKGCRGVTPRVAGAEGGVEGAGKGGAAAATTGAATATAATGTAATGAAETATTAHATSAQP